MTAFDLSEAAKTYEELPAEDLALIAFVDPDYLPEAKQLAITELNRRGLAGNMQDLVARAHREVEFRKQLHVDADAISHEKQDRLREMLATAVLIGIVWMFALVAPFVFSWQDLSFDWMAALLVIIWIAVVIDAIRKARRGDRLRLQLFLIWPGILLLISLACRMIFL
jgi:hypothetical protein